MLLKKLSIGCLLTLTLFTFTGCGKEEKLNLEKIKENIPDIRSEKMSISEGIMNLENGDKPLYQNMEQLYSLGINEELQITTDLYLEENTNFAINRENGTLYLVIKPQKDKKNELKEKIKAYFDNKLNSGISENEKNLIKNRKEEEIDGMLFYIVHEKPEEVMQSIKDTKEIIFGMIMNLTDDNLESITGLNPELLEEYVAYIPMAIVKTNLFMVLKPKKGKTDDVKKQVEDYLKKLEESFEHYLPDQYELIKNRKSTTYGDYLIYIVSTENDRVLEEIKKCK